MAKQLYHVRKIPVRGGVPMRGPRSDSLHDGRPTVVLSSRDLGKRLTLAGLGEHTPDRLGRRIQVLQSRKLHGKPVQRMPISAGRMIPGLGDGSGFMPGLGDNGGFVPGLGGGSVNARLGRAIPHTERRVMFGPATKRMAVSAGKMLPGLASDDTSDVYTLGYLSAANLYDQVDGLGCCANGWSGMPSPAMSAPGMGMELPLVGEVTVPKLLAAGALLAFCMMARKRYA